MARLPNGFQLVYDEHLVICPYDKSHHILNKRFGTHLAKCRTAYLKKQKEKGESIEMFPCTFNYLHHLHSSEIQEHEASCPDRMSALQYVYGPAEYLPLPSASGSGPRSSAGSSRRSTSSSWTKYYTK